MGSLTRLCLCLIVSCANGEEKTGSCTSANSTALLQRHVGLAEVEVVVAADDDDDFVGESGSRYGDDANSVEGEESRENVEIKKTTIVTCQFFMVEQDGHLEYGDADKDSTDGVEYGECIDDNKKVYYLRDDDATEDLNSGDRVSLELEEIDAPTLPDGEEGPWEAEGQPFYTVSDQGASLITTAQEVAAKNREKHGLKQWGNKKEIGFLMVLLNYTDRDLVVDQRHKTPLTEDMVWKGIYSKPEDWSEDEISKGIQGAWADMIEKSSGGKVTLPPSKGKVVTVQMGKTWAEEGCRFQDIGESGLAKAKEQFPGLDPEAYDFREIFMPWQRKPECDRLLTGWNYVCSGVALLGCGHPDVLPNPGGCTTWNTCGHPFVRGHELGHNLGLLHAHWLKADGKQVLDPQSFQGANERFADFFAAEREQLSFLSEKQGEVLHWREENQDPVTLGAISLPTNQVGAGFVAVKWPCPNCDIPGKKSSFTGFLWLQFRGNSSYSAFALQDKFQNKVYVHFARGLKRKRLGKGTVLLAILDNSSPAFSLENSPYCVHLCDMNGDIAKVSLGATPSEAQERCSQDPVNVLYPAPTPAPTPAPPTLAPTLFSKHAGETCGWRRGCKGDNHKLEIGAEGKRWDKAEPDRAEYICGMKCLTSDQCGGFAYDKRHKKCSYRKLATCGIAEDDNRDCYVRQGFIAPTPAPPTPPPPPREVGGFIVHSSKRCGCGQVSLNSDKATDTTVSDICGNKCLASSECGGFAHNKRMKECFYFKDATCRMTSNTNNDCWVKSP